MLRLIADATGLHRRPVFPSYGSAWRVLGRSPCLADLLDGNLVVCPA
jgi:hypothetical protein